MDKFFISKEDLEQLYFVEKLSYSQIEKKLNIKRGRIYSWFKKYEIKGRDYSESAKGRKFTEEHKKRLQIRIQNHIQKIEKRIYQNQKRERQL